MCKYGFNLQWSSEDEGFIATCPDFPSLSAFGETPEEALTEAKVALELFIESLQASGDPLPEASEAIEYSGQTRLRIPKSLHLSLAQNAAKEGVSLNTWLVTLLTERNAISNLADKIFSKVDTVHKSINAYRDETKEFAECAKLANSTFATIISSIAIAPYQFIAGEGLSTPTVMSVPVNTENVISNIPIYATGIYTSEATYNH